MDTPSTPCGTADAARRSDQPVEETPSRPRRVAPVVAVTGAKIPPMSARRPYKSRPGRYKGERKLVGARVWTEIVEQVDEQLGVVERTQNDWLAAAILVALDNPDEVRRALARIDERDPRPRAAKQLSLAEEVLDRTA
ncbi:hypothetical protein GCM10023175_53790 [Pseudonocardia xishanensis]|uniref:Uncharacterized protein n=2 Tax=Pseudonocardia xishanensis TaxID=630995 RepID=A0ABP8RZR0_9PSEU